MFKNIMLVMLLLLSASAYSEVNIMTKHTITGIVNSTDVYNLDGLNTKPFDNSMPYEGKVGIEILKNNFTYEAGYQIKRNSDVYNGEFYKYDGLYLSLTYRHCIYSC